MCKGAQNRIDYIVYQKPREAAKIIEKYGYQVPVKTDELIQVVKLLVRKKGEKLIKDLISIHPEKKLILELLGHKSDESNFCGCHSAYSGETKALLDQLAAMSVKDLEQLYEDTKKKSKESPEDKGIMAQVETIWDELKRRKKQTATSESDSQKHTQVMWLKYALIFLVGVVVAKALK